MMLVAVGCGSIAERLNGAAEPGLDEFEGDFDPFLSLLGPIAYGLMANLCYTGGWILELLFRIFGQGDESAFLSRLWVYGTVGSAILTFAIPVLLGILAGVLHFVVL
ncbi:MAG: hypothetical protein ABIE70_01935 [bacterium]